MSAYPLTARAAINAVGSDHEAILEAISEGRTGVRPCLELGDPPPVCGWLGIPPALPPELAAIDTRVTRILARPLDAIAPAIAQACRRWGASRVAAIIAAPPVDSDALAVALRLGQTPVIEATEAIVQLVLRTTPIRGPTYAITTRQAGGAAAILAARRLLQADLVDAVLTGGCQAIGRGHLRWRADATVPFGEGAALLMFERHGDGFVELAHALHDREGSAVARVLAADPDRGGEIGYRHVVGVPRSDRALPDLATATTIPATGDLSAAAGATEFLIAAACLERGILPPWRLDDDPRGRIDGDGAIVDADVGDGRVALLVRARSA